MCSENNSGFRYSVTKINLTLSCNYQVNSSLSCNSTMLNCLNNTSIRLGRQKYLLKSYVTRQEKQSRQESQKDTIITIINYQMVLTTKPIQQFHLSNCVPRYMIFANLFTSSKNLHPINSSR